MASEQKVPLCCTWKNCGKSFTRKSDLRRHIRVHTGERPHKCTAEDCNKSFIQRSSLTVHSRIHTGEKPHLCQHQGCQKAFADSSSLARHNRTHMRRGKPQSAQEQNCKRVYSHKTDFFKHQLHSLYLNPTANDEFVPTDYPVYPPSEAPFHSNCHTMEDFIVDLDAADESIVPVSTQNIPPLYQPPYFPWPQLPDVHAPKMDDYLSFQFGA